MHQVYLPALVGRVHNLVVITFRAFLDFCYLVRRSVHSDSTIDDIQKALDLFLLAREIFKVLGARSDFALPRQHSMIHYTDLIRLFGAPNGLCSSITESKHIVAVKKPWRRSNRYNALGQMLITNERLDKLHESQERFKSFNMLTQDFLGFDYSANGDAINESDESDDNEEDDNEGNSDGEEGEEPSETNKRKSQLDDGSVDGPRTVGSVNLAVTPRK